MVARVDHGMIRPEGRSQRVPPISVVSCNDLVGAGDHRVQGRRSGLRGRPSLSARQCSGELAYRLLMLLVPDFGKIARDLELHTLVRHDLPRTFFPDTFVKIGDRRAQRAGDLK